MSAFEHETNDYLEGLMEGFVAYDGAWRMTYMNAAAERLLGRRREDVLGRTWHEAFPHAVGNPVDLMYQRVMRSRSGERMEYFYAHYGRWMEISAAPVRMPAARYASKPASNSDRPSSTRPPAISTAPRYIRAWLPQKPSVSPDSAHSSSSGRR